MSTTAAATETPEMVLVPYDDFFAAYRFVPRSKMFPDSCLKTRLRSLLASEDLAHADEVEAIEAEASRALPSTALAARPEEGCETYDEWLAAALSRSADEQFNAATALAANVGCVLANEPDHPDAPDFGGFERAAVAAFARSNGDTAVVTADDYRSPPAPSTPPTAGDGHD